MSILSFRLYAIAVHRPRRLCAAVHSRRCRGYAVWTLVSATCSLHFDGITLSSCISRAVRFPSYAYTDACPGVGSLLGGGTLPITSGTALGVSSALGGGC